MCKELDATTKRANRSFWDLLERARESRTTVIVGEYRPASFGRKILLAEAAQDLRVARMLRELFPVELV